MVYVNHINNPFEPYNSEKESIVSGLTVHNYLCAKYICQWEKFERPTITILNGEAVSQKQFKDIVLKDDDVLCFVVLVGGFDPFSWAAFAIYAVVAASAAAVYYATTMAQPVGVVANDTKSPNSVYNLNGQLNSAKLGQEIPCGYGKFRNWPDYAARPYNLYKNNEQFQFSLYCLGHGSYEIEDIKIGDTDIASFKEIEYEIVRPNHKIELFRDSVVTSIEAANLELLGSNEDDYDGESGPFIVNPVDTRINKIEVDFAFPRGLYEQEANGTLSNLTVSALISYREIDDDGNPVGNPSSYTAKKTVKEVISSNTDKWVVQSVVYEEVSHSHPNGYKVVTYNTPENIWDEPDERTTVYYINRSTTWETKIFTKTLKSIDPRRFTTEIDVPWGRYEIKFVRTTNKYKKYRFGNTLMLESVRGFMHNTSYYGNKTMLAVKALATNNLNNNSAKQLNLVQTRKLRTWTGSEWTERVETRNPIWAVIDVLTAKYSGRISTKYIDLATFKTLADFCDENNIKFDYMFSTRSNVWDTVKTILAVGKMFPVLNTSRVSAIRDYQLQYPEYIYTDDNILKDSFKRSIAMRKLSDYDGLQVEFINGNSYKQESVLCLVGDDAGNNIETLKLIGVSNKTRAKKLGLYHRAMRKYRREMITFRTDAQGYLPTFNSLVGICHNTTNYREFDLVKSVYGDVITLLNKHNFDNTKIYQIIFKQRTGFASSVYYAIPDSTLTDTLTIVELDVDLTRLDGEEPLICQLGESGKINKLMRVKSINPIDINTVEIEFVSNDDRIYSYDEIDDDPTEELPFLDDEDLPVLGDVSVSYITLDASKAIVSWPLNKSAKTYLIEYSYDDITYSTAARITNNSYVFNIIPGQIYIRVAGINKGQGPWSEWSGILAEFDTVPEQIDGLELRHEPDDSFIVGWNGNMDCQEYIVRAYTGYSTSSADFAGYKVFKAPLTKQTLNKSCFVEFTKEWLKNRCQKKEIFFGRQWTFTVEGKNSIGTGEVSEALAVEKKGLDDYTPTGLTKTNVSGNIFNVSWTEHDPTDSIYYKVYSGIVNGAFPDTMTLRKTTKKNLAQITITSTRPTYWRVKACDDWDTDEALIYGTSAQNTIT